MFTHLHNHSEYSLLDGQSRLDNMAKRAAELGMRSLALTDHGNLHGAIDFYKAARAAGVRPIIGCEAYVASGSRAERDPNDRFPFHMTLLARNATGYRNLMKVVSSAHLEGFYYRPRMDREILERHSEGLIVLSGCPSGELPRLAASGRIAEARAVAAWYREVFNDNYYLELMTHEGVPEQPVINKALIELSRETGIPMVVTNDSHYVNREDAPLQDVLTCIQTNSNINDPRRLRMEDASYYLKSEQEMRSEWAELPEALANTERIAESCELEIDFGTTHVPHFATPNGESAMEYLAALCQEGVRRKFRNLTPEVKARLAYELEVIEKTDFPDYFLVVWDIFRFVNERGILSAVRGSAAASLVLYCLDVTQIDPLESRLVFERFLNIERREMPDIDMDFQDDRREEVMRYCMDRYGRDHVAQIITFGTLGAKAAVRDVGRALAMNLAEVDRLARLIPTRLGMTLDKALEESPELAELSQATSDNRRLMETARALEGAVRHASTHAAGVIISEAPLTDYVPLQRATSGVDDAPPATQYSMGPLAELGMLKMDFLGLTNLTILDRCMRLIADHRGETVSLPDVPLNDTKTFELLSAADTFGVFQLESSGMRRYIKELKPNSVADIAAMIALYRPGPMEHITTFIEAKHGRAPIRYPHDALREILDETYGVIVYQDQVLLIAQAFGGYTLGEADILRKAMGKKIASVMAAEREKFISGARAKGFSEDLAATVFQLIEPFAGYAFNKAHSASYAMIAYWTAYFKANHSVEYTVATLDAFMSHPDRMSEGIREARRQRIPVLGPDINRSMTRFSIDESSEGKPAIRFGLAAVKNVGEAAVQPIIDARAAGAPFNSLEDFCRRVEVRALNRRALESLIKVGAFDEFGHRGALLDSVERILSLAQREARLRDSGQKSMFDMFGETVPTPMPSIQLPDVPDASDHERVLWERELLGVEITDNPISREMYAQSERFIVFAAQVTAEMSGQQVAALGQISSIRRLNTRKGDSFLSVAVALLDGEIEAVVWPNALSATDGLWTEGRFVAMTGRVRERDGRLSISVDEARDYTLPGAATSPEKARGDLAAAEGTAGGSGFTDGPANPWDEPGETPAGDMSGDSNGHHPIAYEHDLSGSGESVIAEARVTAHNGMAAAPAGGLTVRVSDTGQPAEDRYLLEDIVKLLLEYRGDQGVTLEILAGGRVVRMAMPFVSVDPCPELIGRLGAVLGAENVSSGTGRPGAVSA